MGGLGVGSRGVGEKRGQLDEWDGGRTVGSEC